MGVVSPCGAKVTSSIDRPELHNSGQSQPNKSQRRQRRTEPRSPIDRTCSSGDMLADMRSERQASSGEGGVTSSAHLGGAPLLAVVPTADRREKNASRTKPRRLLSEWKQMWPVTRLGQSQLMDAHGQMNTTADRAGKRTRVSSIHPARLRTQIGCSRPQAVV